MRERERKYCETRTSRLTKRLQELHFPTLLHLHQRTRRRGEMSGEMRTIIKDKNMEV